jgi:2-polyprenyl-6-hydroxyphenyl methylase/3-demethylubiquinone-9 3-methyltransferase
MNSLLQPAVYSNADATHTDAYLLPVLTSVLDGLRLGDRKQVFELGCGNGATAEHLASLGYEVTGVDPSPSGIAIGRQARPHLNLHVGSSEEDLQARFGCFPVVVSLEVVEHVFQPRRFAACVFSLLQPGGTAILSTPYHGYWKNLALALTGKMDDHFTALWDNGHIKFWSIKTLSALLTEAGFVDLAFHRIGRIAPLAKSMIAVARRPG